MNFNYGSRCFFNRFSGHIYKWPLIDVTRKSVEETAASIIKIHEIYLNNAK